MPLNFTKCGADWAQFEEPVELADPVVHCALPVQARSNRTHSVVENLREYVVTIFARDNAEIFLNGSSDRFSNLRTFP